MQPTVLDHITLYSATQEGARLALRHDVVRRVDALLWESRPTAVLGGGDVGGRGIVGGGPRALQASIRWLGKRLGDLGVVARSLHWSATTRRSVIGWSAVVQGKVDFSLL